MNKNQLLEETKRLGVNAPEGATNAELKELIKNAEKAQGQASTEGAKVEEAESENEVPEADQTSDTASVVEGGSEEKESSDQDKVSTPPTPPVELEVEMVNVKAKVPIYEGGSHYKTGETFEVMTPRAAALGELVEIQG